MRRLYPRGYYALQEGCCADPALADSAHGPHPAHCHGAHRALPHGPGVPGRGDAADPGAGRAGGSDHQRLRPGRRRCRARCRTRERSPLGGASLERSARGCRRRRADHHQGHPLDQRLAHAARQSRYQPGPAVEGGRPLSRPPARGRGGDVRQDDDAGVRLQGRDKLPAHRHQPQSVGSLAHARWLLRRHGGRGGRGPGPAQHGHRRRGQRAHPRRVLRQRRHEGELRPRAGIPALALRQRGACRPAHDERHRLCAHDERRRAARPSRLDLPALRRRRLPRGAR